MLPIAELRLAIPFSIIFQNLEISKVVLVSIVGNFIVIVPIFFGIKYFSKNMMKYKYLNLFLKWIFQRTRKKGTYIEKYKFYGLMLFVGVPLPVTGAWTGCIAAYLFNLSNKETFLGIFFGICISASIISILTLFGYYGLS